MIISSDYSSSYPDPGFAGTGGWRCVPPTVSLPLKGGETGGHHLLDFFTRTGTRKVSHSTVSQLSHGIKDRAADISVDKRTKNLYDSAMTSKLNRQQDEKHETNEWDETSEGKDFVPSLITFTVAPDGIPTPTMPAVEYKCPEDASETTVRCLHGPCDFYAERGHSFVCAGGTLKTRVQRFCSAFNTPVEMTDLEVTVCSAHRVAGKEHGDRVDLLGLRSNCFCHGCANHIAMVFPSQVVDEEDDLSDFCILLDKETEIKHEIYYCQLHTERKEPQENE